MAKLSQDVNHVKRLRAKRLRADPNLIDQAELDRLTQGPNSRPWRAD